MASLSIPSRKGLWEAIHGKKNNQQPTWLGFKGDKLTNVAPSMA
jgi:hypothetical protein